MKFVALLRIVFDADDEVSANIDAMDMTQTLSMQALEDSDTCDVLQVLASGSNQLSPQEIVEQLRRSRDLLIMTRVIQCYDLARELDKTAWVIEHRSEETFDLSGYDWTAFVERANELLQRKV